MPCLAGISLLVGVSRVDETFVYLHLRKKNCLRLLTSIVLVYKLLLIVHFAM